MRLLDVGNWVAVKNNDHVAQQLYHHHYSNINRLRKYGQKISGPGELMTLIRPEGDALFVWRIAIIDGSPRRTYAGLYCSVFRNLSPVRSSDLILEAEELALRRWPEQTNAFTFVDPSAVKSDNPGYCFIRAGWTREKGRTTRGLMIFRKTLDKPST